MNLYSDKTIIGRRKAFLGILCSSVMAGCTPKLALDSEGSSSRNALRRHYASRYEGMYRVPEVNIDWIDERLLRAEVPNDRNLQPGTMFVDVSSHHLYFARDPDVVIRYGVTTGAAAFQWSGEGYIHRIREWPSWTPTARMIREDQSLGQYKAGMPGGPRNPLGARALYIYQNGRDTLFRVHGTNAIWRIGQDFSSGCIRMFNQDVIELASLVAPGAKITVS